MTIKDMHYDFKKKLNKVDSQQNKNLLIPEIDWALNEAQELFVKMVAFPRVRSYLGFEKNQRSTDDIRTIVVNGEELIPDINSVVTLPQDYWYFVKVKAELSKGSCTTMTEEFYIRQHDDNFENSPFDNSSFEWRVGNGLFFEDGIKLYTDESFTYTKVFLSYIKKLSYIHNAGDFRAGNYSLPSGTILSGFVNCELPEHTHKEIVDLAVLLTTGEIQAPDYQAKLGKLNLNKLK